MSAINNPNANLISPGSESRVEAAPPFVESLRRVLQQNIRDYAMFIALFLIMAFFTFTTNGLFISSRNIANLLNQTGYIAVLAVGMTLVIVIRQIDLSVGFLSGFLGALAAIAMAKFQVSVWVVIPAVLVLGVVAGLITAYPVARLGIPSFVASLAGWLIYRGLLLVVLAGTGTVIIADEVFNAVGNSYLPDPVNLVPGVHTVTLLLGAVAIALYVWSEFSNRRKKQAYNFEVLPMNLFILKLVFVTVILAGITWILAGYNGLSWTVVIVLIVVAVYHFITTQTVLGRHIYAVGGNPEAAELSGVSVRRITFIVFGSMGMLSALSGILFASRLRSATPTAGTLFELDAIAAAYIGGVSAAGGVGTIVGSLIGALVYTSLTSGMNLMGMDIAYQYVIRGAVLALAVIFDVMTRNRAK
ncbi:MAG: sugar ABC transporter permease [Chloroflexi bacterium]|nr:sugar ABC transporter permease [Chloroflexota bacterium]